MHRRKKGSKYNSKKVTLNGVTYDSKQEAYRYVELSHLRYHEMITDLTRQGSIPLVVNGYIITSYTPDFSYYDLRTGTYVIEDVKGMLLSDARLRMRILQALRPDVEVRIFPIPLKNPLLLKRSQPDVVYDVEQP